MKNLVNLPVAKRTRNQIDIMIREENKRARLAARRKWIKRREEEIGAKKGGKLCDDVVDTDEKNPIEIISKDEFDDGLNCGGSKVKKEVFDNDYDLMFDDNKGKDIMYNDAKKEGYVSDDSDVVFLGERFDPSVLRDDDLKDVTDDDDDDDDDDIIILSGSETKSAMKGSKFDGYSCKEERFDIEVSSSSEDDDIDFDVLDVDDDESSNDLGMQNVARVVEKRNLNSNNVVKGTQIRESGEKRKRGRPPKNKVVEKPSPIIEKVERQESGEKRKRGTLPEKKDVDVVVPSPIIECGEKVERQENEVKRKRGRPRKNNKDVEVIFCCSSKNEGEKLNDNNELQNSPFDTILERGNEGIDELLPSSYENGGKKSKDNNELQNSPFDTILERGNEGIDEILPSSYENGGNKWKDNNEIQNTPFDTFLERGNEGIDELLPSSYENGGKKLKDNNEIQSTPFDSILERGIEGIDEILPSFYGNGGRKLEGNNKRQNTLIDASLEGRNEESEVTLPSSSKKGEKELKTNNKLQYTLLNTILEEGSDGLGGILCSNDEFYLPLKFRFGIEEENVPQITEDEVEDLEVENLFKELEFSLQACCIGLDESPMNKNEDISSNNGAISQEVLCSKGKHDLIQDDEIGTICKFCSHVELEIKHIMPDFHQYPFGKKDRRDYFRLTYEDNMTYDGFDFPDSSSDLLDDHPSPSDDIPGTAWDLIPGIRRKLYPHQREGFEFIWRNISGGIKMDELGKPSSVGLGGCIVCHAPGTGKTRLAIVFLQSFMRRYKKVKPMIVAPYSMLRTWEEELTKWDFDIPFFNLNENDLTGKEDPNILKYVKNVRKDSKSIRFLKLMTWASGKGVLAISYGLLQRLAGEKRGKDEKVREILLKQPGIVFLDEGHTPRNDDSNIWQVLSGLSTKRRVILSGTPFQNNFEELHNTIALVREEFGGPVLSGYYEQDNRRIQELRKRIIPFVHIHNGQILKETLKGLFHSLLILEPSVLQKKCFDLLTGIRNPLKYDNLVSITAVHPSILLEEKRKLPSIHNELESLLVKHRMDRNAGVKTMFLVELIKLSKGERVLVFGQYLPPLNFIADLLKHYFHWTMNKELLYMDGQQAVKERQTSIKLFNDPKSEARVLLASIKACSEGIHLVGASRVVLLDVVWNPSVERQAISRAYRLGQQKDVFVYHLITSGTIEEDKYVRQATKERLSELVFSSSEECVHKSVKKSRISEDHVLKEMTDHANLKDIFSKIIYQPKADNLIESFGSISF